MAHGVYGVIELSNIVLTRATLY